MFKKIVGLASIAGSLLTMKRVAIVSAAAVGLYTFGDECASYFSTASKMMSERVGDTIPVSFEIERARTMVSRLNPDIKRNLVVIAKEEVGVAEIKKEIAQYQSRIERQRQDLTKLRDHVKQGYEIKVGGRVATKGEVDEELRRQLDRLKLGESTLNAKHDLLASRQTSLASAKSKLEVMLNAKRDLEVQIENLESRMRTVESEAIANKIHFDDSNVDKCQSLVDSLRIRLQVSEKLAVTNGVLEDYHSKLTLGEERDVMSEIDSHLSKTTEVSADF